MNSTTHPHAISPFHSYNLESVLGYVKLDWGRACMAPAKNLQKSAGPALQLSSRLH